MVQLDAVEYLKQAGFETYVVSMKKDGPAADGADHYEMINFLHTDELAAYIEKEHIDVVYSVGSDLAVPASGLLAERLGLPIFVGVETAKKCTNKNVFRKETEGMEGALPYEVCSECPSSVSIPYPIMVKPSDSQGQRGIHRVDRPEDLEAAFRDAKQYSRSGLVMIEKYVCGPEYSVNGYMVDGKLVFFIVSDRDTWAEYTGLIHRHLVPSRSLTKEVNEKIRSVLEETSLRLGILNGPVYLQIKVEGDVPYMMEITPRLDGCHMWKLLRYHTGVDLLRLTYEHLIYGKTDALKDLLPEEKREAYTLEFFCRHPGEKIEYTEEERHSPDAIERCFYYEDGDEVRSVNGVFEKTGYKVVKA